ncbi:MAG TPA: hypothetical protein PKC72_07325 [Chitinophagaceae bacterium]|nr:hypothetical protein [Chitinophagaceae bacterium]
MKHKSYFSIILVMAYLLTAIVAKANNFYSEAGTISKDFQTENSSEKNAHDAKVPFSHEADSKAPHGKMQAPHSEELPHIHKFHKERVKKIKRHHGKFWILSKLILVLCHLSILVIAFLHATH